MTQLDNQKAVVIIVPTNKTKPKPNQLDYRHCRWEYYCQTKTICIRLLLLLMFLKLLATLQHYQRCCYCKNRLADAAAIVNML